MLHKFPKVTKVGKERDNYVNITPRDTIFNYVHKIDLLYWLK
jgi:hypothetical protein